MTTSGIATALRGLGLLALASLSVPVAAGDDPEPAPPAIRTLTANVRYGTARDGAHAWPRRRELALGALEASRPDVLGLQEALRFQVDEVRARFSHHLVIGEGRDGGDRGEWTALLVDGRRFTVRAAGTFRLAPEDKLGAVGWDAALTRIATWAELADREDGGRVIRVINTHFDHIGKQARLESARLIGRFAASRAELPTVVLGDFNAGEKSAPLEALAEAGFRDTFRDTNPDATEVKTGHGFRGGRRGAMIDHVLVNRRLETAEAWIDWTEVEGRYPSDHRFVGALIRRR
jgi:endonuclease/exonuclease/phosphatase family metal-dependent hydrolase